MAAEHSFKVRQVAVLGAGVMGAQIAAHFANANIPTLLFDLPAKEGEKNGIVLQALERLTQLKPPPFVDSQQISAIRPANYDQNLDLLQDCDLVIEAIAEREDLKLELYQRIATSLGPETLLATNTSGISINTLAEALPQKLKPRFCGVHFFNPPRYLHLIELTPHRKTDLKRMQALEAFLVTRLGKGVLHAKDTPNFIANRVGVFSMLATFHHAMQFDIPFEVADQLTGTLIGRPKSATFRTCDVVGLDTLAQVIQTMTEHLKEDPWSPYYVSPTWLQDLIEQGALGQKVKKGIYEKRDKDFYIYDTAQKQYRLADQKADQEIVSLLKDKNPQKRFQQLLQSEHPQAKFLAACFRDLFHYCAVHAETIAENVRDIDLALQWGFGWQQGPFATWQAGGWSLFVKAIHEAIHHSEAMANVALPDWACEPYRKGVYQEGGAFVPQQNQYMPRKQTGVYQRQLYPRNLPGETYDYGETLYETDAIRLWHTGDDIAILSFKTKMNSAGTAVLEGIVEAVAIAEQKMRAFILWQTQGNHFCVGANLNEFLEMAAKGERARLDKAVQKFQKASLALRYANIPTIAAIQGFALGGGCELALHCSRIVAGLETYIGLVEAKVGLLPAGGGCKEYAKRAAEEAHGGESLGSIEHYFNLIKNGIASTNAVNAKRLGYLRETDVILFNPDELLYVAKQQAIAFSESAYHPPLPLSIKVTGQAGKDDLQTLIEKQLQSQAISEHDYLIASRIAHILCGGDVATGSLLQEQALLDLEREAFVELGLTPLSQARIQQMLKTGKPLQN